MIGWIALSAFMMSLIAVATWNLNNQWNIKTGLMSYGQKLNQEIITGASIIPVIVLAIITFFVIWFLFESVKDVYGNENRHEHDWNIEDQWFDGKYKIKCGICGKSEIRNV